MDSNGQKQKWTEMSRWIKKEKDKLIEIEMDKWIEI